MIADTDAWTATKRAELRGKISTMPGLHRFLRATPSGLLRIDRAKAKAEEDLDGKYLLLCADPTMSAADIAFDYKQLLEVERSWGDLKTVLQLRPEQRIRTHVLLCWLALLLIRVVKNRAGTTWTRMRRELDRIASARSPAPPGPSSRSPNWPSPPATCSRPCASTRRARSTTSTFRKLTERSETHHRRLASEAAPGGTSACLPGQSRDRYSR